MRISSGILNNNILLFHKSACNECAKAIIQSGISEIIFCENKYAGTDGVKASMKMFEMAGVKMTQYRPSGRKITIEV